MACTKFDDLDSENPNYRFLVDGIKDGKVRLLEDECRALIAAPPLDLKVALGMKAYLETQGYEVYVAGFPGSAT